MAASRISSPGRICYKYRYFFSAIFIIFSIQLILYSVKMKKEDDPNTVEKRDNFNYLKTPDLPGKIGDEEIHVEFTAISTPSPVKQTNKTLYPNYKPKCQIDGKEAISAVSRAKTTSCKQEIADAFCLSLEGKLYPKQLPNNCHLKGNHSKGHCYGCFKDNLQDRDLTHQKTFAIENSPNLCINYCLRIGYRYAGLQYGGECWCGNQFGKHGKVEDSHCNRQCPGDKSEGCGGFTTNKIFSTGVTELLRNEFKLVGDNEDLNHTAPVKIVFVMTLNGRQVRQVRRLLKAIYHKDHYYYIHVDVRQNYLFHELLPLTEILPNVMLTHNRFATIWGGASLLQAHLTFIHELLQKDWKWDYYVNLSESDYPIKRIEKLAKFLTKYKGFVFLKSHGRDTSRFIRKQGLDQTFLECENHLWRLGPRMFPTGIRVDGGSDWIGLHRDFCQFVENSSSDLIRGLKTVYKYTLLPAESFFHTLLQNSHFCNKWMDNNLHLTNWRRKQGCKCQYKHIVDWCGCSPNDFNAEDLDRLLVYEHKAIFFARKFEPIVNQEIINSMDIHLFGHETGTLTGLTNYWQNEYHHLEKDKQINDCYHSFYQSFMRRGSQNVIARSAGQCLIQSLIIVKEANILNQSDRFHGVLVQYEAEINDGSTIVLESHMILKHDYRVINPMGPIGRLINLEVGSDFDPKENIFRNYARFLGPFSDLVLRHTWGPGPEFTVSIAWIDPANTVAVSHDVNISRVGVIGSHKPLLNMPLRPGVWQCKLMYKWKVVAEVQFLVLPFSAFQGREIDSSQAKLLHNGPTALYSTRDFSDLSEVLQLDFSNKIKEQADLNGQKVGKELQKWIDVLSEKFWDIQGTCILKEKAGFCDSLELCEKTSWSSASPDPKSEIYSVNKQTGYIR